MHMLGERKMGSRFKPLSRLALKYLSATPTSVPSERLLSTAEDIYDEKRNPDRAESLMFIKKNFHSCNNNIFLLHK